MNWISLRNCMRVLVAKGHSVHKNSTAFTKFSGLSRNFGSNTNRPTFTDRIWSRLARKRNQTYNIVLPGEVSPPRIVPPHIPEPPYAKTGNVAPRAENIDLKTDDEIKKMRMSCSLARKLLDHVASHIKVGITTDELDAIAHTKCIELGAYPSPLNYSGYPKSICTSVNNVVCHGIPDDRPLQEGDIISIDVSVYYDGYHGDCAGSYGVGQIDEQASKLIQAAQECRDRAIEICRPGQRFCAIGYMVSKTAAEHGFTVVPAFCGHGIGTYFHGFPDIFHFVNDYPGEMLPGMIFTIEPAISEGGSQILVLEDGWTAVMLDNSRAAQFEHTILITDTGFEVLTVNPDPVVNTS